MRTNSLLSALAGFAFVAARPQHINFEAIDVSPCEG